MSSQCDALARLFRDDDPETVGLVKEQLVIKGESVLPDLRDLVNADSAIVAAHAQEVLHTIAGKKSAADLEALLKSGAEFPLEEASWLIASALMPWINLEEVRAVLDGWGREVLHRLGKGATDQVSVLTAYLNGELRMDGNAEDYYNHENSVLPCVIETRKGLPLTLTLLYIFVGPGPESLSTGSTSRVTSSPDAGRSTSIRSTVEGCSLLPTAPISWRASRSS